MSIGWDWWRFVGAVLIVPADPFRDSDALNIGARLIATTDADGLAAGGIGRIPSPFHTPCVAVGALGLVATCLA